MNEEFPHIASVSRKYLSATTGTKRGEARAAGYQRGDSALESIPENLIPKFGTFGTLSLVHDSRLPDSLHSHPETPGCLPGKGMTSDNGLNQCCSLPSCTGVPVCSDNVIAGLYEMMTSFESFVGSVQAAMIDLHRHHEESR